MPPTGLERGVIRLAPYDPDWPRVYAAERERLVAAVGDLFLDVQHIGSTSVPGLIAKPIIDVAAAVRDFDEAAACVAPVVALGYAYRGENGIPRRHYFDRGSPTLFHLHVFEVRSLDWHEHLLFRDYLRDHPEAVKEYADLKEDLTRRYAGDRLGYTEAKAPFIRRILTLAWAREAERAGAQGGIHHQGTEAPRNIKDTGCT
jgi:GrpB-like predicted nucleotidyltransferase (UPF0157 family)